MYVPIEYIRIVMINGKFLRRKRNARIEHEILLASWVKKRKKVLFENEIDK